MKRGIMVKLSLRKISFLLISASFAVAPVVPAMAAKVQTPSLRPMFFIHKKNSSSSAITQSASENWGGYAASSSNDSFSSVSSSWVEPSLSCVKGQSSYSAYWVGLDGYSDQTVEQIGSEANCINGKAQYYTWYEMYPQNPSEVTTFVNVSPGNKISASVTYNAPAASHNRFRGNSGTGTFTLSLTNTTTNISYSTTQTPFGTADRSSAEVVAEAPYSNGILPLSDFGTVNFVDSEINATALGNASGLQAITMEDPYGMVATPSSLDSTKENFSIVWSK